VNWLVTHALHLYVWLASCRFAFYVIRISTIISQLSSQLESELFVWTYVVGANFAVVLLTALANRCWSLGLMFGYWLMLWLKLTILFNKAYSIHLLMLFTSQTMLGKAKRLIESLRLELGYVETAKSSNRSNNRLCWDCQIIQPIQQVNETLHDSTEWGCCEKSLCEVGSYV